MKKTSKFPEYFINNNGEVYKNNKKATLYIVAERKNWKLDVFKEFFDEEYDGEFIDELKDSKKDELKIALSNHLGSVRLAEIKKNSAFMERINNAPDTINKKAFLEILNGKTELEISKSEFVSRMCIQKRKQRFYTELFGEKVEKKRNEIDDFFLDKGEKITIKRNELEYLIKFNSSITETHKKQINELNSEITRLKRIIELDGNLYKQL